MARFLFTILFILMLLPLSAQQIVPHGQFHKDSVKIGEELPYSLWVRYPKQLELIFPDSLYDFSPFELDRKTYFATKSDSLESLDSVVYYFSTFEIDTVQSLTLPIFLINEYDSVTLFTNKDSIILDQVVTELPDSVTVRINTDYQYVPLAFNYPYFTIGVIIFIVLALILFLVFGNRLGRLIKVFWLSRRYRKFEKEFTHLYEAKPIQVEKTLTFWKIYMEKLLAMPFTKMTSKEIIAFTQHEDLSKELNIIDRYIYAGSEEINTYDQFHALANFAEDQFHQKISSIKNG